ncbi:efflux RND transporter periplasmic adaptor subunit, partial [Candidatus Falkowbacteria bacterium]|nr:efflux RND transporter periplasmic adaptor subunit [Candidatus Falkowbacteria bacterium]
STTLASKNKQSLILAENNYLQAKNAYLQINGISPNKDNILTYLYKTSDLMKKIKGSVSDTVEVLENTTTNRGFSESTLVAQRQAYRGILSSVVSEQAKIQASINSIENISLNDTKLKNSLETAVDSAATQLDLAKVAHDNALVNLEKAKQAKEQQLLSAKMSLDNSLSQLNMSRDQFGDLTAKAPIEGRISKKAVDMGTQVNPGQMIAQISQSKEVKIEINLNSDEVYLVDLGQKVIINEEFEAKTSSINPVADELTRKVKVEIKFDNKDNDLIPGTTVDVEIPSKEEEVKNVSEAAIFIPLKAININQVEKFVFILEDGRARKISVETGEQRGGLVEIVSGLSVGDQLVVDGSRILEDGDLIEIK